MKPIFSSTERGQALIIITLAAIGLFAIAGLAIDGSIKFSDRRHAQNAADNAVLAAALGLVNNKTSVISGNVQEWQYDALQRAEDNGYNRDLVTNRVWVYRCNENSNNPNSLRYESPADCGPYDGEEDYIQVVITSNVNTYFARVIGINQIRNTVSAVSFVEKRGNPYDDNLIVSLKREACSGGGANGNIALGTSGGGGSEASITLSGGGIWLNSDGSGCGMELMGCPTIAITSAGTYSAGNGNINLESNSPACAAKLTLPTPTYNKIPYKFVPDMPAEPDACGYSPNPYTSNASTQTTTLYQGTYSDFPPSGTKKNPVYDNIVLSPGIYCLTKDFKVTNGSKLNLTGTDVLIYIKEGHTFDFEGGTISLTGRQDENGAYKGYVMIVDSDFSGNAPKCRINGQAYTTFTGTVFAPYCEIEIDGGSHPTAYNAQIIGYTVKITGNATVNLYYDKDNSAKNKPKVGLMR